MTAFLFGQGVGLSKGHPRTGPEEGSGRCVLVTSLRGRRLGFGDFYRRPLFDFGETPPFGKTLGRTSYGAVEPKVTRFPSIVLSCLFVYPGLPGPVCPIIIEQLFDAPNKNTAFGRSV